MKAENTFSIDFVTRKSLAHPGYHSLYAKITVNGDAKEISLKQLIKPKEWNSKGECLNTKTPEAQSCNEFIRNTHYLITKKYRILIDKKEEVTAEKVKQAYLENQIGKPKEKSGHKLLELFQYHNKMNGENPETGEKGILAEGTMKNYRTSIEYVRFIYSRTFKESRSISL